MKDDLCLCDFKIGRPTYTLAEQRSVCLDAAKEPGSQSASIIAQIDEAERDKDAQEVKPPWPRMIWPTPSAPRPTISGCRGTIPRRLARWSKEIWTLADAQVFADSAAKKHSLGGAIAEARKNHPNVAKMRQSQFTKWVVATSTVSGTALVSSVEMKRLDA